MVGAQKVRLHYPVLLREPVPHRRRDFVGAGIGAGDQRTVPAPGAADHQDVVVGLTVGAVPGLAKLAAIAEVQPDGREIGAVRNKVPAGGGLVSAVRTGRRSGRRGRRRREGGRGENRFSSCYLGLLYPGPRWTVAFRSRIERAETSTMPISARPGPLAAGDRPSTACGLRVACSLVLRHVTAHSQRWQPLAPPRLRWRPATSTRR
ncbi:hypothetical protein MLGJGCBP_03754 [Rhodococcus sp. T7]|nr:hypothetical protein MLGJGCBP_03754 [Rhodococcus sp. T7]